MKTKLFFVFLIAGALAACTQSAKTSETKVKKTISFLRTDTTELAFSPEGKILKRISFSGMMKQFFAYEPNRVLEEGEGPMNGERFTIIYFLNKNGIADSLVRYTNKDTTCLSFIYDAAGYKIEEYYGCNEKKLVKKRIIENGNLVKEILYSDGKEMQHVHYGHFADKPNRSTIFGEETLGYTFKGKDSKNLLQHMVLTSPNNDTLFDNSFSYHFDEDNRVSLVAMYARTGELIDSVAYYY